MLRLRYGLLALILTLILSFDHAHAQNSTQEGLGAPVPWQIGMQEAASPIAEQLVSFHNFLLVVCFGISFFVLGLFVYIVVQFNEKKNPIPSKFSHSMKLEVIWTTIPILILITIAVPSFQLLYAQHHIEQASLTVKVIGRQWSWDYVFPDYDDFTFSSYMILDDEITENQRRLLEVDNPLVLPVDTTIRILVTAGDVLHSFAVPAFGIKIDAVPGRLNETWVRITREGTYYGQCSELCGERHSYMPIVVKAVSEQEFQSWIEKNLETVDVTTPSPDKIQLATYDSL